jgi:hypothetical protein
MIINRPACGAPDAGGSSTAEKGISRRDSLRLAAADPATPPPPTLAVAATTQESKSISHITVGEENATLVQIHTTQPGMKARNSKDM